MTLSSFNVSYHLGLFPQDQTGGLEPTGSTTYNCIILNSFYEYHFDDTYCYYPDPGHYLRAPLCEAPREALRDGPS